MRNFFNLITKRSLYYSIFHTLIISVSAIFVSIFAMTSKISSEIDLRFIGPVAIFMLVLSVVFTLFPFTLVRVKAGEALSKTNKNFSHFELPKIFVIIESIITAFLLLSYVGAMSGSMWGGIGLILLSVLNIIGLVSAAVFASVGFGIRKYSEESLKYKVNYLNNDNHEVINHDEIKHT